VRVILLILTALLSVGAFGLDIYVAPLLYIDETAENSRDTNRVQTDLLTALWSVETGVELEFDRLKDNRINAPQSLTEAVTVCRNERIEYLLYGYVTRREHSIQAEIRLFDYVNRRVLKSFFGMDDSTNYERLINDISKKILVFIGETFNLRILQEEIKMTRLAIPAFLGYWTPMEKDWVEMMLGTFALGSGLEFIPENNIFIIRGKSFYLSTGLEIKYRFGVGNPGRYEAFNNTLYFMMPVRLNALLANQHEVFFGLGFVYFLEMFSMTDKYDEKRNYVYNNVGLNICIGYRFAFNQKNSLFFRNDFDFLFNERSLITYTPVIGMSILIYEKEVKRKW